MKAITLWQPWANLIALGRKTVETRTHSRLRTIVGHRVAIHAGKTRDPYFKDLAGLHMDHDLMELVMGMDTRPGQVVATAFCTGARKLGRLDSDLACIDCAPEYGRWGYMLRGIQAHLRTETFRGRQGVWELPKGWDAP